MITIAEGKIVTLGRTRLLTLAKRAEIVEIWMTHRKFSTEYIAIKCRVSEQDIIRTISEYRPVIVEPIIVTLKSKV